MSVRFRISLVRRVDISIMLWQRLLSRWPFSNALPCHFLPVCFNVRLFTNTELRLMLDFIRSLHIFRYFRMELQLTSQRHRSNFLEEKIRIMNVSEISFYKFGSIFILTQFCFLVLRTLSKLLIWNARFVYFSNVLFRVPFLRIIGWIYNCTLTVTPLCLQFQTWSASTLSTKLTTYRRPYISLRERTLKNWRCKTFLTWRKYKCLLRCFR